MFEHLKKLEVRAASTADYVFYDIQGEPRLVVKPATEANRPYLNALLKKSKRMLRRGIRKLSVADLQEGREQDIKLYARYVIESWDVDSISDSEGNPVAYSVENCEQFLAAIPVDMFDDLRSFCGDPDNFREEESELGVEEVEELAGN